ncbi:MAG: NAD(P)(+) transhydrogenase (Re/Si-specific) subunit alpha, partial [Cyanobacteria bacterium SW_9_47_5]
MKIAVAKEIEVGEHRVALIPDQVAKLAKQDWEFWVEKGAGEASFFSDQAYEAAGAKLIADKNSLWGETDVLLKVGVPREEEISLLSEGTVLISLLNPLGNPQVVQKLAERKVTACSMETIPRTSRAQSMDALSSHA